MINNISCSYFNVNCAAFLRTLRRFCGTEHKVNDKVQQRINGQRMRNFVTVIAGYCLRNEVAKSHRRAYAFREFSQNKIDRSIDTGRMIGGIRM